MHSTTSKLLSDQLEIDTAEGCQDPDQHHQQLHVVEVVASHP
jgi:hypothetical protein